MLKPLRGAASGGMREDFGVKMKIFYRKCLEVTGKCIIIAGKKGINPVETAQEMVK